MNGYVPGKDGLEKNSGEGGASLAKGLINKKKHEVWETVTQKTGILRVLNMRWEWRREVHGHCKWWWAWAKNHWRFSIGSDTEHVVEAALKIVCQTNSWWGRIPDRGYSLSKSLEVWNNRSFQGIWSVLLLKCGTQGRAGRETRVTDLCALLKSLNLSW